MDNPYEYVYTTNGSLQAEIIRLFLQSHGIIAHYNQESAGAAYGLTIGPLGEVKIFVEAERASDARQILNDMEAGKYELPSMDLPVQRHDGETNHFDDD